jgi:hypothetical protein
MGSINETSEDPARAGVAGGNTASGPGVWGASDHGRGVVGVTVDGVGVWGHTQTGRAMVGVVDNDGTGVWGEVKTGRAIVGVVNGGEGTAVWGDTKTGRAIVGLVSGGEGTGVWGEVKTGRAIVGVVTAGDGAGVWGESKTGVGVHGKGGRLAGLFEGDVSINGHINHVNNIHCVGDMSMANADCAEDFDVIGAESIEPGTVMVLGEEGVLQQSQQAYDKRVAGVISGAGSYKPGIVLDRQRSRPDRMPVGLLGKVYCKVDASHAPIEVGDLLTTAPTPGHAMKATDPLKAFGAVIGKALRPLEKGRGLIPILITLQ